MAQVQSTHRQHAQFGLVESHYFRAGPVDRVDMKLVLIKRLQDLVEEDLSLVVGLDDLLAELALLNV